MNEYIENLNLPSLDEAEKQFCDRPLSEQEIGEALKLMNVGSAQTFGTAILGGGR